MGWLYLYSTSRKTLIDELTKNYTINGVDTICLNKCYRGNNFSGVLWSVWERTANNKTERWIKCDLLKYSKQTCGWGYKSMDEQNHPMYYSCPMKYLNIVSLETYGGNAKWREIVINHHEQKRLKRKL